MPKLKVRGTYRSGNIIELDQDLNLRDGQEVEVDIRVLYKGEYPLIEGQVAVYLARTEIEAGFVIEALAEEGIEATMYSQRDHWLVTTIGGFSIVRVLVAPEDVSKAEAILQQMAEDGRLGAAEDVHLGDDEEE
ncbi:MAG: hypothetical protein D6675_11065 [Gemmatimonadetes bacterium]|nr:MAG: hypothetical protein D6675_11065 [Gemmatimonadota bacterium]